MPVLTQLGKYELDQQIGEGGFGTVWRGRDPLLKRTVAIKTCESDDEDLRRRFLREAEISASLDHPNIVVVHDFGFENGIPFLVQEFLTGEDLSKIIGRGAPVPLPTRLRWLTDVCRGLHYAHCHGVVHRDVKPSNVRILDDGTAKVLDFGIAKLADSDTQHLTRTGAAIGTVGYMAPEQLDGKPVDYRADVFSFGVLAYELLTGRRPFDGETVSRVLFKVLNEDPPALTALASEIPPALERIVLRCLAKLPDHRYGSFRTILDDLERIAAGAPLDLEATGDATADVGRRAAPPAGEQAIASAPAAPVFAPTVVLGPKARQAPRAGFVVAAVVAVAAALVYFLFPLREPPPAPVVDAPAVAPAAAKAPAAAVPARRPPARPSVPKVKEPPAPDPAPPPAAEPPAAEVQEVPPAEDPDALLTQPGPGVVLPRLVSMPPLTYPKRARSAGVEGVVAVAVLVDETGAPAEVKRISAPGDADLDEASVRYALGCRWIPGTRDGVAVPMWRELRVRYAADPGHR